jgi:DNA-binding transcriptional LysR family regulator
MDWDAFQVFLAVSRTGRISAAARRLRVEHTTVSRRLSALEEALGVHLFYRTAAGYLLTPQGQNVLPNAEAMERAAVAVTARAREKAGEMAGRVRIALPPEFASDWLAPKLSAFRETYPRLVLQALVGTRERDLSRGEAELAIQSPRPRQQGLVAVRIARTTTALYAARTLVRDTRLRIDGLEALRDHPVLVYSSPFQLLQDAKWFQPILASAHVALETNSTHALLAAARAGAGIAVLPRFVARAHDDLIQVSDLVAEKDVWLTTHPEFRRDPRVRAAADFLKRIAAGPGGLC